MYSTTVAIGRLTKDPMIKPYSSGNGELALFTLAVNQGKDKTFYYECVCFAKTAELVKKYLSDGKGRLILVEGSFQNNNTEKDINGTKVTNYGMNLVVNRVQFLDAPKTSSQTQPTQQTQQQPQYNAPRPQAQQQTQYNAPQQQQQAPVQQQNNSADPFATNAGFNGFGSGSIGINEDDLPF